MHHNKIIQPWLEVVNVKKPTFFLLLLLLTIMLIISGCNSNANGNTISNLDGGITLYKSDSCGCCGLYLNYLKSKSKTDVKVINSPDVNFIKDEYNIPFDLRSCHTTVVGDYFVEGHIPLEAINKLMEEKPDILGIAMPGMPSGSPGMPGGKFEDFTIYSVNKDGSQNVFMTL